MAELTHSSTHPPLPPTTEEDRLAWLRLLRSRRVGVVTFWRLLAEHGTATAALRALPEVAAASGLTDYAICPEAVALAEVKAARACGARSVCAGDRSYPADLLDIPDAPPFLWARGDLSLLARPMVALVGARNASSLGERMARGLAADLSAAGHVVVSGLARGIDAAAHAAALAGGTVAVMAGGVDVIYPAENTALAADILRMGLLISEQPMGLTPQARHFPTRNRIISGLARAVVVVEAASKSGSLITARTALDQGREVMAVPGHPMDARAAGCNMLIRDGAILIRDARDVIEVVGEVGAHTRMPQTRMPQTRMPQTRMPLAAPDVAGADAAAPGRSAAMQVAAAAPAMALQAMRSAPGDSAADHVPLPPVRAVLPPQSGGHDSDHRTQPRAAGPAHAASGAGPAPALSAGRRTPATHRPGSATLPPLSPAQPGQGSVRDDTSQAAASQSSVVTTVAVSGTGGPSSRSLRDMAALHAAILDRLGPSPLAEDQLIRDLATPVHTIAPILLDLEIEGRILRQPGGLLSRVS